MGACRRCRLGPAAAAACSAGCGAAPRYCPGTGRQRAAQAEENLGPVTQWLRAIAGRTRRVASVCTGVYGLAASRVARWPPGHDPWRFCAEIARAFPKLRLTPNAIFVKDGPIYTSGGVTAGIDLALAMVEEDHGADLALQVARELVVHQKRPGGQSQFSEPLRFQCANQDRLGEVATWMANNLAADLSLDELARRACLSPRQFSRHFKHAFDTTPGDFVDRLRLDEARRRIAGSAIAVPLVAESVGFRNADTFRRAFYRRFGISPTDYRRHFPMTA